MNFGMIKTIAILPGTALIYVPALVVWLTRHTPYAASLYPDNMVNWLAGCLFTIVGLILMIWAVRLFLKKGGGGSPAPWDPIQNLVIEGPYRYFRNPMLLGVILFLIAEALIFQSIPLLIWAVLFTLLNNIYFAMSEEPQLEKRYGEPYRAYKNNVPRWFPRLTPYLGDKKE